MDVTPIPVTYSQQPPALDPGRHVCIVDFSYPRETMIEMAKKHDLLVIDHHKTAAENCADLDFCRFDMSECGATLTWKEMFPNCDIPLFLRYIKDRDLWRWELPNSREFSAGLKSEPMEVAHYAEMIISSPDSVQRLIQAGSIALRLINQVVEKLCQEVLMARFDAETKTVTFQSTPGPGLIPCVNTPCYASETCERLMELYPDVPFVACWHETGKGRKFELRSKGENDCSIIAKQFGGGGHRNAAGFYLR